MSRLFRRQFLEAILGFAVLPVLGGRWARGSAPDNGRDRAMTKDIVMLHGANCGGWCFDKFVPVFESRGLTCHAPDLIGRITTNNARGLAPAQYGCSCSVHA